MGLIKAAMGAFGGTMADQWKEFIYCDSIPVDVLVKKGQKRLSSQGRSSNTSAEDNVISNGSRIAVNVGQCMVIVENGKIVDFCAEPGEYTYDTSLAPSLFTGEDLKDRVITAFKDMGKRFEFGGDPGRDQRVYFFNLKEIIGNKFGTPSPVPYKTSYIELGIPSLTIHLRMFGEYSYKITNPVLFYTNISNNVVDEYKRSEIDGQMKSELLQALGAAFGKLGKEDRIPYDELTAHTMELTDSLNEVLSKKWRDYRGIEVISMAISSIHISDEDEEKLKKLQDRQLNMSFRDPGMAAANLADAQMDAMRMAAQNQGGMGAAFGFMGMNMAQQAGGMNTQGLYNMAGQQQQAAWQQQQMQQPGMGMGVGVAPQQPQAPQQQAAPAGWTCTCGQTDNQGKFCANCGSPKPEPKPAADAWKCPQCGHDGNTGKFCAECGTAKPAEQAAPAGWTCSCGTLNQGKFCANCGSKKPADAPLYKCDKCGWVPPDPKNPPKFCPECGDLFDDNDVQ